jgi:Golgi phosphoprotein 3
MLLMLRDDTGTMESHTHMYQLATGGALLAELLLGGAIKIEDDKRKLVSVTATKRVRHPILSECLELVSTSKKPYSAAVWVSRFGGIRRLRHRIAEELCRKDILEDSEDKVLFFFTRAIYPTINAEPERKLVEAMRDAVMGDSDELDPNVVILIALAQATGLMRIHFGKSELKARKQRIEQIAKGDVVGAATAAAAEAIQAATQAAQAAQAAMMTAIIASTVITSSSC